MWRAATRVPAATRDAVWSDRQQTGGKRLKAGPLNDAGSNREEPRNAHEQSDCAAIVADRRTLRSGLSRRRSRVRVPSLPPLKCLTACQRLLVGTAQLTVTAIFMLAGNLVAAVGA
jgi:hypothetical protein